MSVISKNSILIEPFLLKPAAKNYLWGGDRLRFGYGKDFLDCEPLAETWECSTHPDGQSIVSSGQFEGQCLSDVIKRFPGIVGTRPRCPQVGQLPILVKLIDAKADLSVQVHPDDKYAWECENHSLGKTEMWYVLEAEEGSTMVCGLNQNLSQLQLLKHSLDGSLTPFLNKVSIKKGDCFYIKAGIVHAIGKGALVAEVQENSNLTYRLYDYNRVDKSGNKRPLHIDKALDVVKLRAESNSCRVTKVIEYSRGLVKRRLSKCAHFKAEVWKFIDHVVIKNNCESFTLVIVLAGIGSLQTESICLTLQKGVTAFIPANTKNLKILGKMEILVISC